MGERRSTRISILIWLYFISISLFWLWFIKGAAYALGAPFPFSIPIWLLTIIIPLNIVYLFIYRNKVPFIDFLGLSLPFLFWILLCLVFPKVKTFSNVLLEPGIIAAIALINLARSALRKRFPQTKFTVFAWVLIFILVFVCYVSIPGIPETGPHSSHNKDGSTVSARATDAVKDVFDAYKNAVKDRQYSSLAKYATTESVQKGYHVMKDFQRANFLKYFDNNPYYVSYQGKTEAIIYFKESRNGTASPYIFTKEDGKWKIDFVKISQRIVYGPGNKWRWK